MTKDSKQTKATESNVSNEPLSDDILEQSSGGVWRDATVGDIKSNRATLGQDGNDLLIVNNGDGSD